MNGKWGRGVEGRSEGMERGRSEGLQEQKWRSGGVKGCKSAGVKEECRSEGVWCDGRAEEMKNYLYP